MAKSSESFGGKKERTWNVCDYYWPTLKHIMKLQQLKLLSNGK